MAYTLDFAFQTGVGGLTDLRAQLMDIAGVNVGSAVSTGFVDVGSGWYLWNYASMPDAQQGGVKFYSNASPATILNFQAINPKTGYALSTAGVSAIWANSTRTLTQVLTDIIAALESTTITITIGVTFSVTFTGLIVSATWSKIYFTIKRSLDDVDSLAVVQIQKSVATTGDGLIRLCGGAATANRGSLTVDQVAGTIAVVLADDATAGLYAISKLYYDLKEITSGGVSNVLATGVCVVAQTSTKSIT